MGSVWDDVFRAFALDPGILLGLAAFLVLFDRPALLVTLAIVDVAFGMALAIGCADAKGMFLAFGMALAVTSAFALLLDLNVPVLAGSARPDFATDTGAV